MSEFCLCVYGMLFIQAIIRATAPDVAFVHK